MKNNKKGFVIIETLIVTVMITTCLVLVYSTYSSAVNNERNRLYYNDVSYVYKTDNIKRWLNAYFDEEILKNNSINLFGISGIDKSVLIENYNVVDMLFVDPNCVSDSTCPDQLKYTDTMLEVEFKNYLKTLGSAEVFMNNLITENKYLLVVRFATDTSGSECVDSEGNGCIFSYAYVDSGISM